MNRKKFFEKVFKITEEDIKKFAEVSLDFNPLHLDEKYAKETIFGERICHGMLLAGFISSIIGNDFPGHGTIYLSQYLNFLKPIKIGDVITIKVTLDSIITVTRWKLKTICINQNKNIVIDGEAVVVPPIL